MRVRSILFLVFLFFSFGAVAGDDQSIVTRVLDWQQDQNGEQKLHVEFHYQAKDREFSLLLERIFRESAPKMFQFFNYVPRGTLHIIVNDDAQEANGSATVFPVNTIVLNNVPPSGFDSLSDSDDWVRGLLLHELAHIIDMDQTERFPEVVRSVFGAVGKWGGVAPIWFLEGVTVFSETYFTNGGRLRSDVMNYETERLIYSKSDNFCKTVDCLDNPGKYPMREFPYWIGSHFLSFLENEKKGTITCLIQDNASNFPFFLSGTFLRCTGLKVSLAFERFLSEKKKEIETRHAMNGPLFERFTKIPWSDFAPAVAKGISITNDDLYYVSIDHYRTYKLNRIDLKTKENHVMEIDGHPSFLFPQGDSARPLVTTYQQTADGLVTYWFKMNESGDELQKLKTASTAHYYFKDSKLSFAANRTNWMITLDGETIFTLADFVAVKRPLMISPTLIAFSYFDPTKEIYGLAIFDLQTKLVMELATYKEPIEHFKGANGIFIKDQKQVQFFFHNNKNWYVKGATTQLSKLLVTMGATGNQGFLVTKTDFDHLLLWDGKIETLLGVENLKSEPVASRILPNFIVAPKEVSEKVKERPYPKLSHFAPNYWLLSAVSGARLTGYSAQTSLSDPKHFNTIALAATYYPTISKVGKSASYQFDWRNHLVGVSVNQNFSQPAIGADPNEERNYSLFAGHIFKQTSLTVTPLAKVTKQSVDDFVSSRESTNYSTLLLMNRIVPFWNAFVQQFSLTFVGTYYDVTKREQFFGHEGRLDFSFHLHDRLKFVGKMTEGKLYSKKLSSGILYGGGIETLEVDEFHSFIGLSYSDLFGREIQTARGQLLINFARPYRGLKLFPCFIKEIDLITGLDWARAERVYLEGRGGSFQNKSLYSSYVGLDVDLTLFYHFAANLKLLAVKLNEGADNRQHQFLAVIQGKLP